MPWIPKTGRSPSGINGGKKKKCIRDAESSCPVVPSWCQPGRTLASHKLGRSGKVEPEPSDRVGLYTVKRMVSVRFTLYNLNSQAAAACIQLRLRVR